MVRSVRDSRGLGARGCLDRASRAPVIEGSHFVYLPDEPTPDCFAGVRRIADQVHANPGPGRALPTLVTRRSNPRLRRHRYLGRAAASSRSRGRRCRAARGTPRLVLQSWTSERPGPLIDAPPTDARVVGWAAFKHHLDGYFFWHGIHWQHNSQKQGERRQNVWANPSPSTIADSRTKPISDSSTATAC